MCWCSRESLSSQGHYSKKDEHQEEGRESLEAGQQATHHEGWRLEGRLRERLWILRLDLPLATVLIFCHYEVLHIWCLQLLFLSCSWPTDAGSEHMSTMDTTDSEDSPRPVVQQGPQTSGSQLAVVGGSYSSLSPMIIMNNVLLKQVHSKTQPLKRFFLIIIILAVWVMKSVRVPLSFSTRQGYYWVREVMAQWHHNTDCLHEANTTSGWTAELRDYSDFMREKKQEHKI